MHMAHIHTKPGEYDYTATAYIVYINPQTKENALMLHKHKKHDRYLPVGGHIETNETPWQAVLKEISEESGYEPSQLLVLQDPARIPTLPKVDHFPQPILVQAHDISEDHRHIDLSYSFISHQKPIGTPKENESKDLLFLSHEEINSLAETEIFDNSKAVALHVLSSGMIEKWERIPASQHY